MVSDGLGHGESAAQASQLAVQAFDSSLKLDPKALMERAHETLKPSRGAALAFASIDLGRGEVRFCGVGNISAAVVDGTNVRHLVSHNGIVGHRAVRITEFTAVWPAGASLVMHSDGVSARWRSDEWPGLWHRDPTLIAAALWRDHQRGNDDATVLVARVA